MTESDRELGSRWQRVPDDIDPEIRKILLRHKTGFELPDIDDHPPSSILSGSDIRRLCQGNKPMISPFSEKQRWHGISGGLDYHGYCIHLGNKWMTSIASMVDMKNIAATNHLWADETADSYILAPGACVLAVSRERFIVPKNVLIKSFGKSTFAREGGDTIITPLEPGWEGYLTIEVANRNKNKAIKLWDGMPITQLICYWVTEGSGYDGIYQHQQQVPTPALGNAANTFLALGAFQQQAIRENWSAERIADTLNKIRSGNHANDD